MMRYILIHRIINMLNIKLLFTDNLLNFHYVFYIYLYNQLNPIQNGPGIVFICGYYFERFSRLIDVVSVLISDISKSVLSGYLRIFISVSSSPCL